MNIRRFLLLAFFLFAGIQTLQAQIQVSIHLPRDNYIAYEPVIATVTVKNFTGRDITLHDSGIQQWFGFQISNPRGEDHVAPRDPDYHLAPITIPAGKTVQRSVNLVSLYPITEFGSYRVQADIYFTDLNRYFRSRPAFFNVTEGTLLWQQTVGVPAGQTGAGSYRQLSLIKFDDGKHPYAYLRIQNKDAGIVYCTQRIGLYLDKPTVKLDSKNTIYILQLIGPKTYVYNHFGLDGQVIAHEIYLRTRTVPHLVKSQIGDVGIIGGVMQNPGAVSPKKSLPKLSGRPANMPKF